MADKVADIQAVKDRLSAWQPCSRSSHDCKGCGQLSEGTCRGANDGPSRLDVKWVLEHLDYLQAALEEETNLLCEARTELFRAKTAHHDVDITVEQARDLQFTLRTLTASGVALNTSARELVRRLDVSETLLRQARDELSEFKGKLFAFRAGEDK